ncbi:Uroporphyrin-III C/tetrapyrrole (Corrin/Porphyrin) methyltransferase [Pyrobaculum islandicum DSM 4184]|uniref:uroporphyrinogen-III C-methyltransferase n=1 Tax=Pyrobaculum islandicum (strain DSM 4184 / JCM 9189 / GEO3) TaxID=384616 RepID=A1RQX9_PYRIL|nr:uroporphyrinogen-III C-methyltransferase [Pyrobaculum islandicum]ABL87361.1 Uroporphyrin-III C/tetrapyrrole (Corrin/Porphyrin) methyltransferase [Pyrobaculum islandicum DSM 4184]
MPLYVVGAGPGDPKLLTIRARELLEEADVVAYGDLVPEEVVKIAKKARVVKIGHRRVEHDAAIEALIEEARWRNVVILKNGDPTIFGRGVKVCKMARERGVPCEIVPGVSSFTAAAALFQIELTDGENLRHIALLSYPHFSADILREIKADTLVIFMMGDKLQEVSQVLAQVCNPERVYLCVGVSLGGYCEEVSPEVLGEKKGLRPTLVIVQRCTSSKSIKM